MTPTLVAVLITGHGARRLSLHTRRDRAVDAAGTIGRELFGDRFGYDLGPALTGEQVAETLRAEGWQVTIDEQPVDLP